MLRTNTSPGRRRGQLDVGEREGLVGRPAGRTGRETDLPGGDGHQAHPQRDVDVAAGGVGVRAHLVRRVDQLLAVRPLDARQRDDQLDGQAETLALLADADLGGHRGVGRPSPSPCVPPPAARCGNRPRSRRRTAAPGWCPRRRRRPSPSGWTGQLQHAVRGRDVPGPASAGGRGFRRVERVHDDPLLFSLRCESVCADLLRSVARGSAAAPRARRAPCRSRRPSCVARRSRGCAARRPSSVRWTPTARSSSAHRSRRT